MQAGRSTEGNKRTADGQSDGAGEAERGVTGEPFSERGSPCFAQNIAFLRNGEKGEVQFDQDKRRMLSGINWFFEISEGEGPLFGGPYFIVIPKVPRRKVLGRPPEARKLVGGPLTP